MSACGRAQRWMGANCLHPCSPGLLDDLAKQCFISTVIALSGVLMAMAKLPSLSFATLVIS